MTNQFYDLERTFTFFNKDDRKRTAKIIQTITLQLTLYCKQLQQDRKRLMLRFGQSKDVLTVEQLLKLFSVKSKPDLSKLHFQMLLRP